MIGEDSTKRNEIGSLTAAEPKFRVNHNRPQSFSHPKPDLSPSKVRMTKEEKRRNHTIKQLKQMNKEARFLQHKVQSQKKSIVSKSSHVFNKLGRLKFLQGVFAGDFEKELKDIIVEQNKSLLQNTNANRLKLLCYKRKN